MKTLPSENESSTQNSTVKQEKEAEEEGKEVEEQILDESEIHQKKLLLKPSPINNIPGGMYSPKSSTASKYKGVKKANSQLQHGYQSVSQPASGLSNHTTNRPGNESINANETETERIL